MKSEILTELQDNMKEIEKIIDKQKFTIGDAKRFLKRYNSFAGRMEELEKSRNNWKGKYLKLNAKGNNQVHSPSQQTSVDKREVVHIKKTSDVGVNPISDTNNNLDTQEKGQ